MGLGHDVQENTDTIGGRISLAREALELSDAQAADAICVCVNVWSDWERDRSAPPPQLLELIAQSLQVTLYWLLTGEVWDRHGAIFWRLPLTPGCLAGVQVQVQLSRACFYVLTG